MFGTQDGPLYVSFFYGAQSGAENLRLQSYDEIRHVVRTFIRFDTAQHRDLAALVERLGRGTGQCSTRERSQGLSVQ